MANLGTLWFGADVDLSELKKKIQQGNKDVLDALKLNYDAGSYQQMVSRLRSELGKEDFEIKISTNVQSARKSVQSALDGARSTIVGGGLGRGIGSIDALNDKFLRQKSLVIDLENRVKQLALAYQKTGGTQLRDRYIGAQAELANEKAALEQMKLSLQRANMATRQLADSKRQASQAAREFNSNSVRLNTTLAGGIHISTQLGSALSSLYSVHLARQFLGNVIEIGGQLEQQRIAIGAILNDTAHATTLFNQIKGLAVQSPFGVVDLDQATKRLAAYGFQYNELYDMTKRLADISAGAGTDIGRLTNALGHVKSQTYLTGITLKMFTMNNIPMIKMLADYYSELEQRIVSTAEVQKRISSKQVSYEDVIEQIRRLTDEGGMFYEMQEKISESVSAKWKNLKDSLDIMYGELAESGVGDILKGTAESLMTLTKNWRTVISVMTPAVAAFGIARVSSAALNYAIATQGVELAEGATRWQRFKGVLVGVRGAVVALGTALKGLLMNPVTWIMAVVETWSYLSGKQDEEERKAREFTEHMLKSSREAVKNIEAEQDKLKPYEPTMKTDALKEGIEEMKNIIKSYSVEAGTIFQEAFGKDESGKVKTQAEQYEYLRGKVDELREAYDGLAESARAVEQALKASDGGWSDDNLETDVDQYIEAINDYDAAINKFIKKHQLELDGWFEKLRQRNAGFREASEGIKDYRELMRLMMDDELAYYQFRLNVPTFERGIFGGFNRLYGKNGDLKKAQKEAKKELDEFVEQLRVSMGLAGKDITELTIVELSRIKTQVESWISQHSNWNVPLNGIAGQTVAEWLREGIYNGIKIPFKEGENVIDPKLDKPDKKTPTNTSKKDTQLEKARTQLEELKSFMQEYRKYKEVYGREKSIDLLEQLFPTTKGRGAKIVDDYKAQLEAIKESIALTSEARKKFGLSIDKLIAEDDLKNAKEVIDAQLRLLDKTLEMERKRWDTYKKVLDATGSKQQAANLAFGGQISYANFGSQLRSDIERSLSEMGKSDLSVDHLLSLDDKQLEDLGLLEKGIDGVRKKVKLLRDVEQKEKEEQVELWLEAYKGADEYALEIDTIRQKYERLLAVAEARRGEVGDETTDKIISGIVRSERDELSKAEWKEFQRKNDWGRVFGDLDNMSLPTIKRMISAMREFGKTANMSAEETKAWQEAMRKLTDKQTVLDPLKSLTTLAEQYRDNNIEIGIAAQQLDEAKEAVAQVQAAYDADPTPENAARLAQAQEQLNKATEHYNELLDEQKRLAKQAQNAFREIGATISQLGSDISQLGSDIGGKTGDIMQGFGSMFSSLGKGFDSIASGKASMSGLQGVMGKISVITALISAVIQMNKALAKILPTQEKMYEAHAREIAELNKLRHAVDDYRVSVAKANAERGKLFGKNGLSGLKEDAKVSKAAMDSYVEEAVEAQAVYTNKKAGWKKTIGPVVGAIVGIIAGIFTFGLGASLAAPIAIAIGTAVGSLAVGAVSAVIIAAGIGSLVGQLLTLAGNAIAYKEGETAAINNLRIETRSKNFWHDQKTENLVDWARSNLGAELFDPETGLVNVELAKTILQNYGDVLVGETKATLERLTELSEQVLDFYEEVDEYVGDKFSPLADNMTDAIWDWLTDGKDAMDQFYDYASDTFRDIAKDAIKSFLKVNVLDQFQDKLSDLYKGYGLGIISEEELMSGVAQVAGSMATAYQSAIPIAQRVATTIDEEFKKQGFDLTSDSDSTSSTAASIENIQEETAEVIASYLNAIRADVAMNRADFAVYLPLYSELMSRGNAIADMQVQRLDLIATNTAKNAEAAEQIAGILENVRKGVYRFSIG